MKAKYIQNFALIAAFVVLIIFEHELLALFLLLFYDFEK